MCHINEIQLDMDSLGFQEYFEHEVNCHTLISHDVKATMLVSRPYPLEIDIYYANVFLCFPVDHVSGNQE